MKGAKNVANVIEKLSVREKLLGSYVTISEEFYSKSSCQGPCDVLVYLATEVNPLYVGPVSEDEDTDLDCIADTVVHARGTVGPNTEYVTRLADYIRKHIPEERDDHLFKLDIKIRNKMILVHEHRHQG